MNLGSCCHLHAFNDTETKRGVGKGLCHGCSSLRTHVRLGFTRISLLRGWGTAAAGQELSILQIRAVLLMKGDLISSWLVDPALAWTWLRRVLEGVDFGAAGLAQWHLFVRYPWAWDYPQGSSDFLVQHPMKIRLYLRTPFYALTNWLSQVKQEQGLKLAESVFSGEPRPVKCWGFFKHILEVRLRCWEAIEGKIHMNPFFTLFLRCTFWSRVQEHMWVVPMPL